jgi:cell division protein ZapA
MEAYDLSEDQKIRTPVTIYGQHYIITGTESSAHVKKVARLVDEKMHEIRAANPALDMGKLAVLTAVNAVHDYIKLHERYEQLEKELERLKD